MRATPRLELSPYEPAVCRAGYRWLWAEVPPEADKPLQVFSTGGPERGRPNLGCREVLLPVSFEASASERRLLTPRDAGIHREFAALEPTQETIASFARRYGVLRGGQMAETTELRGTPSLWWVDSYAEWCEEIEAARAAIALWDSTNKGRNATAAVLEDLVKRIDGRLGCELRPVARPDTTGLAPKIQPATLAGAIWLQIFAETARSIEVVRCRQCGRWFSFDPRAIKHATFLCSAACRSAAYRKRQAEARALARAGLSTAAIARRLDWNEERIGRWVEKP